MAECPFCKATIEDELARFGGHCPKCFIEIPGDETPTDPGLAKRVEEQLEQEQQRPWGRIAGMAALAAVVLIAAGSVVTWRVVQQRGAEAKAAQQESESFYIAPATDHQLPQVGSAEPEGEQPAPMRSYSRSQSTAEIVSVGSGGSGSKRFDFTGNTADDAPKLAEVAQRSVEVNPGSVEQSSTGFVVPGVEINRGTVGSLALSDPDEIYAAVDAALKGYGRQLNSCYERRLKATPELAGRWEIAFSITEGGRPKDVVIRGQTTQDAEFERCMRDAIARWTFQPLALEQDFSKTYTFEPAR